MRLLDTNMILRFLLNDNPEMSLKAKEIIENEVVSVTTEVIAEVVYVLSSYYKFERIEVAKAVTGFLNMQSVRSDSYSVLVVALLKYSEVSLDFVDCLLYAYNRVKGYDICTFDNKLLKHITTQRISPASAGGGFYLSAQSEYNLRLNGSDSTNRLCLLKAEL